MLFPQSCPPILYPISSPATTSSLAVVGRLRLTLCTTWPPGAVPADGRPTWGCMGEGKVVSLGASGVKPQEQAKCIREERERRRVANCTTVKKSMVAG